MRIVYRRIAQRYDKNLQDFGLIIIRELQITVEIY